MSKIALSSPASGTATFTVAAPVGSTDRTLTLPDNSGTLLSNASTAGFPAGSVLQVVSAAKVDTFTTSSTSPVDVTGLSVSITPSNTSNRILVLVQLFGGSDPNSALYANILRNSTALNVGTGGSGFNSAVGSYAGSASFYGTLPIMFLDSPNTTSATTYKVQVFTGTGAGAVAINRRWSDTVIGGASTITLMEIAA